MVSQAMVSSHRGRASSSDPLAVRVLLTRRPRIGLIVLRRTWLPTFVVTVYSPSAMSLLDTCLVDSSTQTADRVSHWG